MVVVINVLRLVLVLGWFGNMEVYVYLLTSGFVYALLGSIDLFCSSV